MADNLVQVLEGLDGFDAYASHWTGRPSNITIEGLGMMGRSRGPTTFIESVGALDTERSPRGEIEIPRMGAHEAASIAYLGEDPGASFFDKVISTVDSWPKPLVWGGLLAAGAAIGYWLAGR